MTTASTKVLCIGGTGQNGATLVSRLLGRLPGVVAVGELGRIWDKGLLENQLCGCGVAFHDCPFWAAVGQEAFGGWDSVDGYDAAYMRESVRLKRRLVDLPKDPIPSIRHSASRQLLPVPLLGGVWPRYRRHRDTYAELMGRLYRGIHTASRGAVIVDSMKVPYHVFLARKIPDIDLRVLHLVRDPRGVAFSQLKYVEKQSQVSGMVYRGRQPPAKTGLRWLSTNLDFHLLRNTPVRRIQYEQAVSAPRQALEEIASFAGLDVVGDSLAFIAGDEIDLPPEHLVAGNRVRLERGPVRLRVDDAWRSELPKDQQRLVSIVTRPLLRLYGYPRSAGAAPS